MQPEWVQGAEWPSELTPAPHPQPRGDLLQRLQPPQPCRQLLAAAAQLRAQVAEVR